MELNYKDIVFTERIGNDNFLNNVKSELTRLKKMAEESGVQDVIFPKSDLSIKDRQKTLTDIKNDYENSSNFLFRTFDFLRYNLPTVFGKASDLYTKIKEKEETITSLQNDTLKNAINDIELSYKACLHYSDKDPNNQEKYARILVERIQHYVNDMNNMHAVIKSNRARYNKEKRDMLESIIENTPGIQNFKLQLEKYEQLVSASPTEQFDKMLRTNVEPTVNIRKISNNNQPKNTVKTSSLAKKIKRRLHDTKHAEREFSEKKNKKLPKKNPLEPRNR